MWKTSHQVLKAKITGIRPSLIMGKKLRNLCGKSCLCKNFVIRVKQLTVFLWMSYLNRCIVRGGMKWRKKEVSYKEATCEIIFFFKFGIKSNIHFWGTIKIFHKIIRDSERVRSQKETIEPILKRMTNIDSNNMTSPFLIQAVKDKAISPDYNGNKQGSQCQCVVSLNRALVTTPELKCTGIICMVSVSAQKLTLNHRVFFGKKAVWRMTANKKLR
jgi:hypothetical protein